MRASTSMDRVPVLCVARTCLYDILKWDSLAHAQVTKQRTCFIIQEKYYIVVDNFVGKYQRILCIVSVVRAFPGNVF